MEWQKVRSALRFALPCTNTFDLQKKQRRDFKSFAEIYCVCTLLCEKEQPEELLFTVHWVSIRSTTLLHSVQAASHLFNSNNKMLENYELGFSNKLTKNFTFYYCLLRVFWLQTTFYLGMPCAQNQPSPHQRSRPHRHRSTSVICCKSLIYRIKIQWSHWPTGNINEPFEFIYLFQVHIQLSMAAATLKTNSLPPRTPPAGERLTSVTKVFFWPKFWTQCTSVAGENHSYPSKVFFSNFPNVFGIDKLIGKYILTVQCSFAMDFFHSYYSWRCHLQYLVLTVRLTEVLVTSHLVCKAQSFQHLWCLVFSTNGFLACPGAPPPPNGEIKVPAWLIH